MIFVYKINALKSLKNCIDNKISSIFCSKKISVKNFSIADVMSFFGLIILLFGFIFINEDLEFPSTWALVPVVGTILVIASGSKAFLNRLFLTNPVSIWFGLISYPLYLWHWPILSFLQITEGSFPNRDNRICAVAISILLSWLTYKFIETPIRFGFLKQKLNQYIYFYLF